MIEITKDDRTTVAFALALCVRIAGLFGFLIVLIAGVVYLDSLYDRMEIRETTTAVVLVIEAIGEQVRETIR